MEALFLTDALISWLLFLRPPSQNPLSLNFHTNSVFLHSRKRSAPVTDTCFASRECPPTRASTVFLISLRILWRTGRNTFKFSGLYNRIRPAKLSNHSARTNWQIIRTKYKKCVWLKFAIICKCICVHRLPKYTYSSVIASLGSISSLSLGSLHSCTGVFSCLFWSVMSAPRSISNFVIMNVGSVVDNWKNLYISLPGGKCL